MRLQAQLRDAWKRGVFTQESLAGAVGKKQTTIGQYLLGKRAGSLDLDEADAALQHMGSSLSAFLAGEPPRELTDAERIGHLIIERPGLRRIVELLLSVPKTRLGAVADLIQTVVLPAIVPPRAENGESRREPTAAPRTTKAPRRRR